MAIANGNGARGMVEAAEHDIVETAEGTLMIVLDGQRSAPSEPYVLVSGSRSEAILYRGSGTPIRLGNIHQAVIGKLRDAPQVTISELNGETVAHTYPAVVQVSDGAR